ncbi:MAG: bifunctional precorrin-2 dehydrogenase/sirohydrochlorin ferrochelatase [Thermodesulfobacteriota bacterium]
MRYLPILVDLAGRPCLVVGGGAVAARKAETLLDAGARVKVVAPRLSKEMERVVRRPGVQLERRDYREGDVADAVLAFAATDEARVQERVARDARAAGVWVNAVDEPERCTFVMPAILDRDPLVVAVGTAGASPALARRVRDDIGSFLGPEYEAALAHLALLRARYAPGPARQAAFSRLVDGGLIEALRARDAARVESLTRDACGGLAASAEEAR